MWFLRSAISEQFFSWSKSGSKFLEAILIDFGPFLVSLDISFIVKWQSYRIFRCLDGPVTTPASVKILPRSCLVIRNPAAPTSPGTDLICPDLFIFWGEFICAILEPPFKKVPYSWQKPWMMCWSQELGSASQRGWTCIFFSCRFVRHSKHHFPSFSPYLSNNFHSPVVSFLHLGWASWSTNLAGFVVRPKLVSGNFSDEKKDEESSKLHSENMENENMTNMTLINTDIPLVNIQKANWNITMLLMGKSTNFRLGHFQVRNL